MLGHRLRHRITIEEPVNTQDSVTGEIVRTWSVVRAQVPAEVLTGPGRERIQSGALQADTAARITVRWFNGLHQKMRIRWGSKVYNIKTFRLDRTGRRFYFIDCGDEGVNEG